ncbi:deoxynucleoside triphosphate triphosphohydrolase SAMHD1-like [Amblyomma americanum]
MSCKLLEHLITANGLQDVFDAWELHFGQGLTHRDLKLIQDLIMANLEQAMPSRRFLFQIVSNDDSGLDVDKWDYYLRDCHAVGVTCGFQYERLVSSARVIRGPDGAAHIAFRDKEVGNVYEMFRTRSRLHHSVYRHHFVGVVEAMVCDALRLADEKLRFVGHSDNRRLRLWQTTHDAALPDSGREEMEAFVALTDHFVELSVRYADSGEADVVQAKAIWNALECRFRKPDSLYRSLGSFPRYGDFTAEALRALFLKALPEGVRPRPQDLLVNLENVHWGRAREDPVKSVLFYRKYQPEVAVSVDRLRPFGYTAFLPSEFEDSRWHVILRTCPEPGLEEHLEQCFDTVREMMRRHLLGQECGVAKM